MGLIPGVEPLLAEFLAAEDRDALLAKAKATLPAAHKSTPTYLRVLEKLVAQGDAYLDVELVRVDKLLASSVTRPDVRDIFIVRRNLVAELKRLQSPVMSEGKEEEEL